MVISCGIFFFFKQKTAYEMRISDWSSDVCSSDLASVIGEPPVLADPARQALGRPSQMLMAGVAQGLVRLDATGQVEPGIAERWIVIDDGMSYTFRIGDRKSTRLNSSH